GMGKGSPRYAQKWKTIFEGLPDPETARGQCPQIVGKRFDNGEWVFAICESSHGSPWGGTVVLKGSTGEVGACFGHACRERFLEYTIIPQSKSLDELYRSGGWRQCGFQEYTFP